MKLNKNKYVSIGMLFLVLAIILNEITNISDLVIGILYGISIGVLAVDILSMWKISSLFLNLHNIILSESQANQGLRQYGAWLLANLSTKDNYIFIYLYAGGKAKCHLFFLY